MGFLKPDSLWLGESQFLCVDSAEVVDSFIAEVVNSFSAEIMNSCRAEVVNSFITEVVNSCCIVGPLSDC